MALFLTARGRTPSRKKTDTGSVKDLLGKRIPDEKLREYDKVHLISCFDAIVMLWLPNKIGLDLIRAKFAGIGSPTQQVF